MSQIDKYTDSEGRLVNVRGGQGKGTEGGVCDVSDTRESTYVSLSFEDPSP